MLTSAAIQDIKAILDANYLVFFETENNEENQALHDGFNNAHIEQPVWHHQLTDDAVDLVDRYERNKDLRVLEEEGKDLIGVLLASMSRFQTRKHKRYIVVKPEFIVYFDMLAEDDTNEDEMKLPFGPIFSVLSQHKDDLYLATKLCAIANVMLQFLKTANPDHYDMMLNWIINVVIGPGFNEYIKLVALSNLSSLLKNDNIRECLAHSRRGIKTLTDRAKMFNPEEDEEEAEDVQKRNDQVLYQVLNSIWILTFNNTSKQLLTDANFIRQLCFILRKTTKGKLIRMSVAILRRIVNEKENGEIMISSKMMNTLDMLAKQDNYDDIDINANIEQLQKDLIPVMNKMSSFDRFRHEVLSGQLDWTSPAHKSQRFWRENIQRFEENHREVLHALKDILEDGIKNENDRTTTPDIVALACWDIGEFVRFHPRGCKIPIMQLLESEDEMVQTEALLALQKLMTTKWEYLTN